MGKINRKHRCYLSFGNRCLQSVEIPMRFPRFSAVLAEFSTSTAENSKRLADFYAFGREMSVIQIILAKLFRIDGDTVLVSSIALINSPPFVPLVAAALNNKDVVLTGISIGLLGYAVGNYLGIGIYELFAVLSL